MTNREKFKSVFGVDFEDFDMNELDKPYGKYKEYSYTLREMKNRNGGFSHSDNIIIERGIVLAKTKAQARESAIIELGKTYRRFSSNRPMYCLEIEKTE